MKIFLILIFAISSASWAASEKGFTGSPEVYYNEAITAKEQGDLPAASLALRRSLLLDPTLKVAQEQLKEVLSKMGLPISSSWQERLASQIAPEKISYFGMIVGWSMTFLLILLFFQHILSSTKKPKRWTLFFGVLFFCFLGHALSVLGVVIDPRLRARYEVILLPKNDGQVGLEEHTDRPTSIPLRATPADASSSIAEIPIGSCLILLSQHGAWSYVRASTGEEGWIASGSLESLIPKK